MPCAFSKHSVMKADKKIDLQPNTAEGFRAFLKQNSEQLVNEKKAHLDEWETVDFLFQLTDEEISRTKSLFDSSNVDVSDKRIESYIFFAIKLKEDVYRRSELAEITREINRIFPMPVMILFRHGDTLTFSIIDRRLHKKDSTKDVLEKVTLIKDIRLENPHRAHVEILSDLALNNLKVKNFVELHKEWQRVLDTKELNKKFFQELANWYFWAVDNSTFPADEEKDKDVRNATNVIRLITRLMFVWFLKEKGLVSEKLFNEKELKKILRFKDDSAYYKAILQNLFFATLNSEMNSRKFIAESSGGRNTQHFVHNVFRYQREFIKPEETIKELFEPIPFLNGGLFECLDKETEVDGTKCRVRVDGFSDHPKNVLEIPDELFFGSERQIELNEIYGTKNKKYKVRGLINILNSYKFTITENTPIEEEIALDPELLGKVFENLLANFNPETKTTARKQTGSFYTPREIVNYMVDESLLAYLKAKLQTETQGFAGFVAFGENQPTMFGNEARIQQKFETAVSNNRWHGKDESLETALRKLFSYTEDKHEFNETETEILLKAIDECKILDPACGSGAFPMGILHRLVHLLGKLDKDNEKWREWQRLKAIKDTEEAYEIGDHKEREERLLEINDVFENNASDYGRKLFLIENCIYGVDIQPIAIQIAKLRFFISLIVDQKTDAETRTSVSVSSENALTDVRASAKNRGIRPLPNLETKFVAANTLIGLEAQGGLKPEKVNYLEKDLKEVRAKHFSARTRKTKEKYRAKDKEIRLEIANLLKQGGIKADIADQIAKWNPYDQNASADWFDAEYMFGIEKGFDIVIGNPPYFGISALDKKKISAIQSHNYKTFSKGSDVYCLFYERGFETLKPNACLCFITSNRFCFTNYGIDLRKYLSNKNLLKLINFNEIDVFESANVGSLVGLAENKMPDNSIVNALDFKASDISLPLDEVFSNKARKIDKEFLRENQWSFEQNNTHSIKQKLERNGVPFIKWKDCSINRGITTGLNEVFIIPKLKRDEIVAQDPKSNEILRPVLKGANIKRYLITPASNYLIYTYTDIDINKYKGVLNYLNHHKERLQEVWEAKHGQKKWYELRRCTYYDNFSKTKLVWTRLSSQNAFAISENGEFTVDSSSFAVSKDARYLCGILNSKAVYFYFKLGSVIWGKDGIKWFGKYFDNIPIPKATNAQQTEIAEIVDEIIEAKKQNPNADTSKLEGKIDALVYQLYGLTDEEIRIVEGKD